MLVWILNASEQIPFGDFGRRPMRAGLTAQALAKQGHQVLWWSSTFEHASRTHSHQGDGIEEIAQNIRVSWICSPGYKNHVSLARAYDHWYLARRFSRLSLAQPRPDLILCSFPIPDLAAAGVRYGLSQNIPVVVDIRDWWPDTFLFSLPLALRLPGRVALAPYELLARYACSGATAITGITPAFVEWGLKRARRSRGKFDRDFLHGYDVPDLSAQHNEEARKYWDDLGVPKGQKIPVFSFIGSVNRTYSLAPIIEAARDCAQTEVNALFVICGDGDKLHDIMTQATGLKNLKFSGEWVGAAQIQELLRRTSAGIVPMPPRPDYLSTINNKAIEYLSASVPIIVSPKNSLVAEVVRKEGCGVDYDGTDGSALFSLIQELIVDSSKLEQMSQQAGFLFRERFSASKVYSEFAAHLERIVENSKC